MKYEEGINIDIVMAYTVIINSYNNIDNVTISSELSTEDYYYVLLLLYHYIEWRKY